MKLISKRAVICSVLSLSAAALVTSCGKKESDPDPITLADLKSPTSLSLIDMGGGKVKLTWTGSNNEDDFDGYNIYGMNYDKIKSAMDTAKVKEGEPISLLDAAGEPIEAVKNFMATMSFDKDKPFESPAASTEVGKVEYYPYYKNLDADGKKVLPSCRPSSKTCDVLTEATQETLSTFNGKTSMTLEGLKAGSKYCFAVFSSMSKGGEISATSSPLRCLTVRTEAKLEVSGLVAGTSPSKVYSVKDRTSFTDALTRDKVCPFKDFSATEKASGSFCIEVSGGKVGMTSGDDAFILDAGYVENGFDTENLPTAPKITLGTIANSGGYNVRGQSLTLEVGQMMIVATKKSATTTTDFTYDYYWVKAVDHDAGSATLIARLQK